uniref:t-SNARE coiled-coil homology domain-containing protein n=1 Tax=Ciona savignyi TaxID=51511 RepID=H2YIF2_CIOSA
MLDETNSIKRNDYDKVSNDLRNGLRSIEWDLEDLDETIGIVESNPTKFRIDASELGTRREFISATRTRVQEMKNELSNPQTKAKADKLLRNNLLQNGLSHKNDRHSRVKITNENENNAFLDDHQQKQQLIIKEQDDQLELVADSVGMLKNMSRSIGNELDEQAVMLDGLGHEMETTQNRMDTLLRKMAKVTKMSSGTPTVVRHLY